MSESDHQDFSTCNLPREDLFYVNRILAEKLGRYVSLLDDAHSKIFTKIDHRHGVRIVDLSSCVYFYD